MRHVGLILLALLCGACKCDGGKTEGSSKPALTGDYESAPECTMLRSMHATSNKRSGDFARKNKAQGGSKGDLFRGYAKLAKEDAAAPARATSTLGKRYEERMRDIRLRAIEPFLAAAKAEDDGDTTARAEAEKALVAIGNEWRKVGAELADGCAKF